MASFLLPAALWFYFSRDKAKVALLGLVLLAFVTVMFFTELRSFFDPGEYSNRIKLALLGDYIRVLSDAQVLFLGQGLGAYEYWEAKEGYAYISELTYLELFRNFGFPGGLVMLSLVLFPLWHAFFRSRSQELRAVAIGFGLYIIMCASNPNLFNSMGVLILSVLLARIYLANRHPRSAAIGDIE